MSFAWFFCFVHLFCFYFFLHKLFLTFLMWKLLQHMIASTKCTLLQLLLTNAIEVNQLFFICNFSKIATCVVGFMSLLPWLCYGLFVCLQPIMVYNCCCPFTKYYEDERIWLVTFITCICDVDSSFAKTYLIAWIHWFKKLLDALHNTLSIATSKALRDH